MKKKILLLLAACLVSVTLSAGEKYNILMISDTHFGSEASFGPNPPAKIQKKLKRCDQAIPNFRAMFAHMAKTSDASTRFLIHAGDVIEGYGHTIDAHAGQFFLAESLLKEYFKFPIYMVRGNHEAGGRPHGYKAYTRFILPNIAKNAGQPPDTIHYTIKHGEDLFIFVDAYRKNVNDFIRDTLKNLSSRPRYIFLVIHPDVLPQVKAPMMELTKILLPFDVIVLNGHTHRNRILKYTRDGHTITQYSIGSFVVADTPRMRYESSKKDTAAFLKKHRGTKKYVPDAAHLQLFDKEVAPFIHSYQEFNGPRGRNSGAGYARLHISDDGVSVTIQNADLSQKPFEIKLVGKK